MGQNVGDGTDGGFSWIYLLGFPLVLLFRMARISFSFLKFLVMFLIGEEMAETQFVICFWWNIFYLNIIGQHVLATFRWLVWLFSYFKIKFFKLDLYFW